MRALVSVGDHLYMLARSAQVPVIARIDKKTGAQKRLALGPGALHLAIGRTSAYWTTATDVWKASLSLEDGSIPIAKVRGQLQSLAIAPDDALFWTSSFRGAEHGGVFQLLPDRTEAEMRTPGGYYALFADTRDLFVTSEEEYSRTMFWRMPRDEDLHRGRRAPSKVVAIAADGEDVFIAGTDHISHAIREHTEFEPLATNQPAPVGIVVDERFVYFADAGSVRRVPRAGGAVEILADEGRGITSLAVDSCAVYWTSDRGVTRRHK